MSKLTKFVWLPNHSIRSTISLAIRCFYANISARDSPISSINSLLGTNVKTASSSIFNCSRFLYNSFCHPDYVLTFTHHDHCLEIEWYIFYLNCINRTCLFLFVLISRVHYQLCDCLTISKLCNNSLNWHSLLPILVLKLTFICTVESF